MMLDKLLQHGCRLGVIMGAKGGLGDASPDAGPHWTFAAAAPTNFH